MIWKILEGVSLALHAEFGDGYPIIAKEPIPQNLPEPGFFLSVLSPALDRRLGDSFFLTLPLDVHYFPADEHDNREMLGVAHRLWLPLALITLPDGIKVRGGKMSTRIVDGVLHFLVEYTCFLSARQAEETMTGMVLETNIAEG